MKWILIAIIRLYWLLAPQSIRERCIFRETCSRHVMRCTHERGVTGGWRALTLRMRQCRPGYVLLSADIRTANGSRLVLVADGSLIDANDLRTDLFER